MWGQVLVSGLVSGGNYALLALGFSLVFGVARLMNLTHTASYMLAAYLFYYLGQSMALGMAPALLLSVAAAVAAGVVSYRLLVEPLREQFTAVLIVTLVLAIAMQEVVLLTAGSGYRSLPPLIRGNTTLLGIPVTYQHLLTLGVVLAALLGTWFLLLRTKLGIAIRATAQDREIANLMGMNVAGVAVATIVISVTLAAVAGITMAPLYVLHPAMWMHPLIIVLTAVILGGIGSIKGSVFAALILGFAEALVVFLVPKGAFLREAVTMVVMLAVLLVRPEGLFGTFFEGER